MKWRCLKEGELFSEPTGYRIYRAIGGYRIYTVEPYQKIGEAGEGEVKKAKALCEKHAQAIA